MDNLMPNISVVIVNWNGMRWLEACLSSLMSQTYKRLEVVFVDNDSTDGSCDYVAKNFPSVVIVRNNENQGFARAVNLGIANATGELIMLLNTDTWLEPKCIEDLLTFYLSHDYSVVGPHEAPYKGGVKKEYVMSIDPMGHPVRMPVGYRQDFYLSGVCILFSKDLYEITGGLDGDFFMYFEEIDWFWRMHLAGLTFGRAENLVVHHAGAGSSGGGGIKYNSFLWRNQNVLQMLLKNYRWYNLLWVLPIYFLQNIFEIVVMTVLFRFQIARSYFQGWIFNLHNLPRTLCKRKVVQNQRIKGDTYVLRRMLPAPAKLIHLFHFLSQSREGIR